MKTKKVMEVVVPILTIVGSVMIANYFWERYVRNWVMPAAVAPAATAKPTA